MMQNNKYKGVWFIYDGDCPMCRSAAQALVIKEKFGALHLINARDSQHPLLQEVTARHFDLDEGMVIYHENAFYHGRKALRFMAKHGAAQNAFMGFCKSLYWSDTIASITYPWMRGTRNGLLKKRNIGPLDNLNKRNTPIFKDVFGENWDVLPPVLKKHYANRPYSDDSLTVKGNLDVLCKGPVKWFSALFWMMGGIPPHNEKNVPVTVRFKSEADGKAFVLDRDFDFKTRKAYHFKSRMIQIGENDVVEVMPYRIGWRMTYLWQGNKVVLQHKGYVLQLFGHLIPVPLTFLMGKGYAEEWAIDDNHFEMLTHITHPVWGKIYEYKGRFKIIQEHEDENIQAG